MSTRTPAHPLHPMAPPWPGELTFPRELPETLRNMLLVCSEGAAHRAAMARMALTLPDAVETPASLGRLLGMDLLAAAWESDPLDPDAAAALSDHATAAGRSNAVMALVAQSVTQACAAEPPLPDQFDEYEESRAFDVLMERLRQTPASPCALRRAIPLSLALGKSAALAKRLRPTWPEPLEHVRRYVLARLIHMAGHPDEAAAHYRLTLEALDIAEADASLGLCLLDLGHREEGVSCLARALKRRPWRVNLRLLLHDLVERLDQRRTRLAESPAVLIQTKDNADALHGCLEGLAKSELRGGVLLVLDRASTDATPQVLESWSRSLGADRLQVTRLPVDPGAPAALNWLLSLEAARERPLLALVEDDVLLPTGWLDAFALARERYPEAGAWGCRVRRAASDALLLEADRQPCPTPPADPAHGLSHHGEHAEPAAPRDFVPVPPVSPDPGYYAYCRPALSVSSACRLIPRATLELVHGYDLRFSPDGAWRLDMDLRLARAGKPVAYTGRLDAARQTLRPHADADADAVKLAGKLPDTTWNSLRRDSLAILRMDLEEKSARLTELLE